MKKIVCLLLALLMFVSLFAACGTKTEEAAAETTEEAATTETTETTEEAATEETSSVAVEAGATMIRTTQDWPTYYDPGVGSSYSCSTSQTNIYDPLYFPQADGSIIPWLATDMPVVSEDAMTYTITIKEGVKFHSGNEMKASDVAYSMNRMLAIGEGYAYLYQGVVETATAIDDYTVEFKLSAPFGPFTNTLIRFMIVEEALVREHYNTEDNTYGDECDYGKTWMLTNDAGSGPYKTVEFKLDEYLLAEKFDDYFQGWEEKPNAPQYFKISNMTDAVAVRTAVANDELEITDELQPLENYETMDAMEGVDLSAFQNGNTFNMMLNTKATYTDDIHLRKAIALCFDYETVRTSIYPGALPAYGPVPTILPGFNADIPTYERDVEAAKAELAQSKYAGEEIVLQLTWCAEVPEQEKIALLLQANLQEIGIGLEITSKPFGSMITDAQSVETTPQVSFVNFASPYFEAGGILKTRYHSGSCGTWENMEWLQDAELDAMIEDALATVDQEERFAKYAEIQQYIYDLCPTVWGFSWIEKRAVLSDRVTWGAYEATVNGTDFFMPMGYAIYCRDIEVQPAG